MNLPEFAEELRKDIRKTCSSIPGLAAEDDPDVLSFYLLCLFDEAVLQSGFPYLLKNLNGSYLNEMEWNQL